MLRDYLLRNYTVSPDILIKPLQECDLEFTLLVRNSPGVRECFYGQEPITYSDHKNWFYTYLENQGECMFCIFFGGVRAGQIGIYNYNQERRSIEVGRLFIAVSLQGNGIMKAVLKHLLEEMRNVEVIENVHLSCKKTNYRAISLYKSLGFKQLAQHCATNSTELSIQMAQYCKKGELRG